MPYVARKVPNPDGAPCAISVERITESVGWHWWLEVVDEATGRQERLWHSTGAHAESQGFRRLVRARLEAAGQTAHKWDPTRSPASLDPAFAPMLNPATPVTAVSFRTPKDKPVGKGRKQQAARAFVEAEAGCDDEDDEGSEALSSMGQSTADFFTDGSGGASTSEASEAASVATSAASSDRPRRLIKPAPRYTSEVELTDDSEPRPGRKALVSPASSQASALARLGIVPRVGPRSPATFGPHSPSRRAASARSSRASSGAASSILETSGPCTARSSTSSASQRASSSVAFAATTDTGSPTKAVDERPRSSSSAAYSGTTIVDSPQSAAAPSTWAPTPTTPAAEDAWPPRMPDGQPIPKKLMQPRFLTSPERTTSGEPVKPGIVDWTITMNPRTPDPTEAIPIPTEITNDQRLTATRYFMIHSALLFRRLHERKELIELAAGAEISDEEKHEHAQQAGSFRTRKKPENHKEYLRALLSTCTMPDPLVDSRVYFSRRGRGVSGEYHRAYTGKQAGKGLIYDNVEGDGGHFQVGMTPERWERCVDKYEAYAGNSAAKEANPKKQANVFMPAHWGVGPRKPLPFSKSNALEVSDGFCERAGLLKLFPHSSFIRRAAWTAEGGRHKFVPSWALVYGRTTVNPQQIDVLDKMAMMPLINADSSYTRYVVTGEWDPPDQRDMQLNPLLWSPSFVIQEQYVEQLGLREAQEYCESQRLPPRIVMQQRHPPVPKPKGHAVVIDLRCPNLSAPSFHVCELLAEKFKFNVTSHIYDLGKDAGTDDTGLRSATYTELICYAFANRPLDNIRRSHTVAYLSTEAEGFWRKAWLEFREHDMTAETPLTDDEMVRRLIAKIAGVDPESFKGIVSSPSELEALITASTPTLISDDATLRRTCCALYQVSAEELAALDLVRQVRVPLPENVEEEPPRRPALSGQWRAPRSVPGARQPIDELFDHFEFDPSPQRPSMPDEGPRADVHEPELSKDHHFIVAWRYGSSPVANRQWKREELGEYLGGASEHASRRLAMAAAREARCEANASRKRNSLDAYASMLEMDLALGVDKQRAAAAATDFTEGDDDDSGMPDDDEMQYGSDDGAGDADHDDEMEP